MQRKQMMPQLMACFGLDEMGRESSMWNLIQLVRGWTGISNMVFKERIDSQGREEAVGLRVERLPT